MAAVNTMRPMGIKPPAAVDSPGECAKCVPGSGRLDGHQSRHTKAPTLESLCRYGAHLNRRAQEIADAQPDTNGADRAADTSQRVVIDLTESPGRGQSSPDVPTPSPGLQIFPLSPDLMNMVLFDQLSPDQLLGSYTTTPRSPPHRALPTRRTLPHAARSPTRRVAPPPHTPRAPHALRSSPHRALPDVPRRTRAASHPRAAFSRTPPNNGRTCPYRTYRHTGLGEPGSLGTSFSSCHHLALTLNQPNLKIESSKLSCV